MYLKYKIQKYIYVFSILKTTLQNTKWHNGKCPQTLSQLMFNKFKQDCSDIKATASRKIRLTVHFVKESSHIHVDMFEVVRIWMQAKVNSRVTADEVLAH